MSQTARVMQPEYLPREQKNQQKSGSIVVLQTVTVRFPKASLVFGVLFAFCLCFFVLYRYSTLSEMNFRLNQLNSECADIKESSRMLKVDIESSLKLDNIREIAENRYGMHDPITNQIVPVHVPKSQYSVVVDSAYIAEKAETGKGLFAWALDTIGAVLP